MIPRKILTFNLKVEQEREKNSRKSGGWWDLSPTSRGSGPARAPDSVEAELEKYIGCVLDGNVNVTALDFWSGHKLVYSQLTELAEDLVAAPASEAFVERIFSVARMLLFGRRNRMTKSLEMRGFLKLNYAIVDDSCLRNNCSIILHAEVDSFMLNRN